MNGIDESIERAYMKLSADERREISAMAKRLERALKSKARRSGVQPPRFALRQSLEVIAAIGRLLIERED